MVCKKCGAQIRENDMFCRTCGEKVTQEVSKSKKRKIIFLAILILFIFFSTGLLAFAFGKDYLPFFDVESEQEESVTKKSEKDEPRIEGIVIDKESEDVIVGASVFLESENIHEKAVTDEEGKYEVSGIKQGKYTISVSAKGYEKSEKYEFEISKDSKIIKLDEIRLIQEEKDDENVEKEENAAIKKEASVKKSPYEQYNIEAELASLISKTDALEQPIIDGTLNQTDMNAHMGQMFSLWDDYLNVLWGRLKTILDSGTMENLTQIQLDWIAEKENRSKQIEQEYGAGGSLTTLERLSSEYQMTRERVYFLIEYFK